MTHNDKLISLVHPKSIIAEVYRTPQTNIKFAGTDQGIKLICITSPDASEGISMVCTNLSLTYSQTGHRVLLIDGDLGRPKQFKS